MTLEVLVDGDVGGVEPPPGVVELQELYRQEAVLSVDVGLELEVDEVVGVGGLEKLEEKPLNPNPKLEAPEM